MLHSYGRTSLLVRFRRRMRTQASLTASLRAPEKQRVSELVDLRAPLQRIICTSSASANDDLALEALLQSALP